MPPATNPLTTLLAAPPPLPVVAALPHLRTTLTTTSPSCAVVLAPPGTGKTTLVPPLVADLLTRHTDAPARVIVTQPRRLAARAAAHHLAGLLGETVGDTVGYAVRGEHRTSPATRIEVVTAGLLLRRLQAQADLPGVGAVILDEVHERSLDSDLLLALLLDARALREDLTIVAMSATADLTRLPTLLGTSQQPAPVITVEAATHPVAERWAPPPAGVGRLDAHGVPRAFLDHVARTTATLLDDPTAPGDILVFLPGAGAVDHVASALGGHSAGRTVRVLPLHRRLDATAQQAALTPSPPGARRVIVSTAVAESSLTVPGVRVVVDSLLAREPRLDVVTGMSGLATVTESRSSATQRAGRAGREASGVVVRCGAPTDWARMPAAPTPEILSADLTRTALELAAWGSPGGCGLSWIDPPPPAALAAAQERLRRLGLASDDGSLTSLGRAVARVPADVGLARALVLTAPDLGARKAAQAAALLSADLRVPGGDLTAALGPLRRADLPGSGAWRQEAQRLERAVREARRTSRLAGARSASSRPDGSQPDGSQPERTRPRDGVEPQSARTKPDGTRPRDDVGTSDSTTGSADAVALITALAHPEWIARRRGPAPPAGSEARYVSVGGTGMRLPASSPLAACEWLAVGLADRGAGRADALIRSAAPADEQLAREVAQAWQRHEEQTSWDDDTLRVSSVTRLGAIELSRAPMPSPDADAVARAVTDRCQRDGLTVLSWQRSQDPGHHSRDRSSAPGRASDRNRRPGSNHGSAAELRARLALLHRTLGEPWPAVDDASLLARAQDWLAPAAQASVRPGRRFRLADIDVEAGLRLLLPWPEAADLDRLAPERIEVPSGSRVRLRYRDDQGAALDRPILAVRIQECFGWSTTPTLVNGRVKVLLHLLSPAQRPVAVTDDLASFWEGPYQQVRRELRGRYPKHDWPEDPWNAPPQRGGRRRTASQTNGTPGAR